MHDLDLDHGDDDEDVAQDDEDAEGDKVRNLGHRRHTASHGQAAGVAVAAVGAADVGELDIGSFGGDQFRSLHGDWNWLVPCQGPAIDFCHTYSLGTCWISLLFVVVVFTKLSTAAVFTFVTVSLIKRCFLSSFLEGVVYVSCSLQEFGTVSAVTDERMNE